MEKLYDRLFPEDTEHALKRWRVTVSQLVFVLAVFCVFTVAAMTSGVPGIGGLVWDQRVRREVDESAKPIKLELEAVKTEQGQQRQILQRLASSVESQLSQSKAAEIRLLVVKRCRAAPNSVDRELLIREIEQAQEEYTRIKGGHYVPPLCSEL